MKYWQNLRWGENQPIQTTGKRENTGGGDLGQGVECCFQKVPSSCITEITIREIWSYHRHSQACKGKGVKLKIQRGFEQGLKNRGKSKIMPEHSPQILVAWQKSTVASLNSTWSALNLKGASTLQIASLQLPCFLQPKRKWHYLHHSIQSKELAEEGWEPAQSVSLQFSRLSSRFLGKPAEGQGERGLSYPRNSSQVTHL